VKRLEMRSKHPLAIHWCHWVNFPLLALMIWSGLWIYWANNVYRVGLGSPTPFTCPFALNSTHWSGAPGKNRILTRPAG
jgi:hypothetical protein